MGDAAGIGPEICLRLLAETDVAHYCVPLIFGDAAVLIDIGERLQLTTPPIIPANDDLTKTCRSIAAPTIIDFRSLRIDDFRPGEVNARTGKASFGYVDCAIAVALARGVDAVTTGPMNKQALDLAGVPFPGHTEIFADRTQSKRFCMMQTCSELTCSFVTTHVGYRDVPALLTRQRIVEVLELSHAAVQRIYGTSHPRLAVCGLNPHAGEGGLFGGGEEEATIMPAIVEARERGMNVEGPLPPDTAFLPARRAAMDCIVCMYHDQGHIPVKALAFDLSVNVTLGLPIVRTSVDHGTACDIAWQGIADISSLRRAVDLACKLAD